MVVRLCDSREAKALPERLEVATHVVACLGEIAAAGLRADAWHGLCEVGLLGAQAPEQYVIGVAILRVKLEALALEPLHQERLPSDCLLPRLGDRVPQHR